MKPTQAALKLHMRCFKKTEQIFPQNETYYIYSPFPNGLSDFPALCLVKSPAV